MVNKPLPIESMYGIFTYMKTIKINHSCRYICLFPKIGVFPPKWMVKIMENPINIWMIWGYQKDFGAN